MKILLTCVVLALILAGCAPPPMPTPVAAATPAPQPTATAVPLPPTATSAPTMTPHPSRTIYPAPTNPIPATVVHTEISPLGFVQEWSVDAWFDNPNPPMGSNVTLSASLLKNGLWTGGMQMYAHWVQGGELKECSVLVIYQRGICTIPVEGFEPGVYVPVTYTFHYGGRDFTGYAGFTPR